MFLKLFPRYAGRARRGATVAGDNLRGTAVVVENALDSFLDPEWGTASTYLTPSWGTASAQCRVPAYP